MWFLKYCSVLSLRATVQISLRTVQWKLSMDEISLCMEQKESRILIIIATDCCSHGNKVTFQIKGAK